MRNVFFFIILIITISKAQIIPYFSPGVMIAWNTDRAMTASLKISLGYMYANNVGYFTGYSVNITLGRRVYLSSNGQRDYRYIELEEGLWKDLLYTGTGFGLAFYNNKHIAPKFSIYSGDIGFLRADISRYNSTFDIDIGGMLVIPFNQYLFNPPNFNLHMGD